MTIGEWLARWICPSLARRADKWRKARPVVRRWEAASGVYVTECRGGSFEMWPFRLSVGSLNERARKAMARMTFEPRKH